MRERDENDGRREVPWPHFDALDASALLWWASPSPRPERDARVREAVASCLSDKQREVVEAYFFEGLSQSEIARRLGVRQQVVHKRIYGARRNGRVVGGALKRLAEALAPLVRT